MRRSHGALLALSLAACGAVAVPAERFYGLALPDAEPGRPATAVLRVHDLQAVGAFDRDYLVVTDGQRYAPRPLDRWVVPVDRMLTEALVVGLSRRGAAELVLGAVDPGLEDWRLCGRILEFAEARTEAGNDARITLELWVTAGDRLLLRDEFAAREPIEGEAAEAVVGALSRAFARIVADLAARLRTAAPPPPVDTAASKG